MARRQSRQTLLRLEGLEGRNLLSASTLSQFSSWAAATSTDDYGNTAATATVLTLSSDGAATKVGTIEKAGDVDMFKFVATSSGKLTISESAASGSSLDSYLYVYRANQTLLARNDDYGTSTNSQLTITVTAGTTYYIKAAAYSRSTGAYVLQLTPSGTTAVTDDYGNTFATATTVTPNSDGAASQTGKIEQASDVDMFKIVTTVSGTLTITQSAATGSRLDSYLYIYDANQKLVGSNDDSGAGTTNSSVSFTVVAGTTYYIKAAAYSTSTGAYTLQLSTKTASESGFQIDVETSGMTAAQEAIVQEAVDRWEEIILGDVQDVYYNGQWIDDILIDISFVTIDGEGSVLGQAGPTAYRTSSYLPCAGVIQLDSADVASMQSDGTLLAVLEHEMAHVLGFGIFWEELGLLTGTNTTSPGFTGANAVAAYNALFGTNVSSVPVEADGGSGTALAHWDETAFNNELMTGYVNSGSNPLSAITIASMADLGYTVNMSAADSYSAPSASTTYSAVSSRSTTSSSSSHVSSVLDYSTSRLRAFDQVLALYS